jgi:hypothetical protein
MSRAVLIGVFFLGCAGCSSSAITCWPGNADTYDVRISQGCSPYPTFEACEAPSDGGADSGETCSNLCGSTEYSLSCFAAPNSCGEIPAPDPSLSCTALCIAGAPNQMSYCCPCAP